MKPPAMLRPSWPSTWSGMATPLNSAFDGIYPPGIPSTTGPISSETHRRGDRRPPRARPEGARGELDRAHLSHQRRSHRVAPDETAFAYRDATFATVIAGMWPDAADNEANTKWVRTTTTRWRLSPRRAATSLHVRRRPGSDQGELQGELRPADGDQAQVRPRQPVPFEPEHPTVVGPRVGKRTQQPRRPPSPDVCRG